MSIASRSNQKGTGYVGAGAAAGATIGSFVPVIGTALGGAIGAAVGGIAGALDIGSSAKKKAKKAREIVREREQNQQESIYLQMIRQARIARAGSLAASTTYGISSSSLATSALSSIGSQSQYSVQYTANDQRLLQLYNRYMKQAGDYSKAAQNTLATGQLVGTVFTMGAAFAGASAASTAAGEAATAQGISSTALGAVQSQAYSSALSSGMSTALNFSAISSPIVQGVSQYNQL